MYALVPVELCSRQPCADRGVQCLAASVVFLSVQASSGHCTLSLDGAVRVRSGQAGSGQVRLGQVRSGWVRSDEDGSGQQRLHQVG